MRAALRRIRALVVFFMAAVALSGLTAFPLELETGLLLRALERAPFEAPALTAWVSRVHGALVETGARHPFLAYGTDWLGFAHLMIALAFWGVFRDPVRNVWVVEWGLLCCLAVLPAAALCGEIRSIPWGWRFVDMSFGLLGVVPLAVLHRDIARLAALEAAAGALNPSRGTSV